VREGTAADVLADQAQCMAFVEQGGVGQVLGKAPVARDLAGGHLAAVVIDLGHARVQLHFIGMVLISLASSTSLFFDLGRDRVDSLPSSSFGQSTNRGCSGVFSTLASSVVTSPASSFSR
jgi:hypothetical protein